MINTLLSLFLRHAKKKEINIILRS